LIISEKGARFRETLPEKRSCATQRGGPKWGMVEMVENLPARLIRKRLRIALRGRTI